MPSMPRPSKKATNIAFKLLGVPPNLAEKPKKNKRKIEQRLLFEETQRVR